MRGAPAPVAYGIARDLVLGLEVVLADGRIMNILFESSRRTTPATTCAIFSSAPKGRSGSSPPAVVKLFPAPARRGNRVHCSALSRRRREAP
jgi:D-lactate dehydrogenase (cytochrome)